MTLADWRREAQAALDNHSTSSKLDIQLLLAHVLKLKAPQLLAQPERELTQAERHKLDRLLNERISGNPIAYLTGVIEFYGFELVITPDVLVPRPETEQLVTLAANNLSSGAAVIDVGTGSGAIAVALQNVRPDLEMTASDNSADALAVAKQNITTHQLAINLVETEVLENVPQTDAVVANLPYLPTSRPLDHSVRKEPRQALLSGVDGLDHYRQLFKQLQPRTPTQNIFIEAEPTQRKALQKIAESSGYSLGSYDNYAFWFRR